MEQQREEYPPRVSVESMQDWRQIKSNVSEFAMSLLESRLGGEADEKTAREMRAAIQNFLDGSYSLAEKNIRANGHNLDELDPSKEDDEPFDEALDKKIWALHTERITRDLDLAKKRRTRPREIEGMLSDMLRQRRVAAEKDHDLDEDDDWVPEDNALDERALKEAAKVVSKSSALAEELDKAVGKDRERLQRVQAVEKDLRSRKK
ncbi:hypothetical protein PENSPDRAFT_642897 [Peniophora sp. CONT]|nr:hypothetical protein PENSPDRAFT_642897 [Peniophora sp. CONT]